MSKKHLNLAFVDEYTLLPLLPPHVIFLPSGDQETVVNESSVECEIFPSSNPVSTFHKWIYHKNQVVFSLSFSLSIFKYEYNKFLSIKWHWKPWSLPRRNLLAHKRQGVYYQGSMQKMRLLDFLAQEICLFLMWEFLGQNPI